MNGDPVFPRSLARPPALRPGDRVAVICASGVVDSSDLETGLDALRFAGLDLVVYPSATEPGSFRPYLAGDDKTRAADLVAALTDPEISGIVFARGGYGAQRTLERVSWDAIASSVAGTGAPSAGAGSAGTAGAQTAPPVPEISVMGGSGAGDGRSVPSRAAGSGAGSGAGTGAGARPKVLAGFSDVTAILEAVAVKLGWASVFGPMPSVPGRDAHYSFGSLLRTLMRPADAMEIRYPDAVPVTGGVSRGVTMGGTLTLLSSSAGTPTSWPAHGGILLLEDVQEEPYRLDRMLTQLRRSGYLDGVAGVVTGTFTDCGPREEVHEILAERLGDLAVPMLAWANVGHGGPFQAFPIGIAAELDADAATLRLLDPPLIP